MPAVDVTTALGLRGAAVDTLVGAVDVLLGAVAAMLAVRSLRRRRLRARRGLGATKGV